MGVKHHEGTADQVLAYVRISEDRTSEAAGVGRQREDCVALCARLGLPEPEVFMDNDTSAFLDRKRPGYAELLRRARLGATRLVVWHVDRLYRRPRELEDLIELVESHPIRIEAVMGGAFDLNTHEGRLMARQLVAIASYESGHKADRIRRANRQKAERGDWHGAARFGYGQGGVLIPAEAAIIREMADRCLAGQSLRSIAHWLNEYSGARPPLASSGTLGVWHSTTVKSILTSARISGQRAYHPAGSGTEPSEGRTILRRGNWEPIISVEETAQLRSIIFSPDRRVSASSIRLLSAIAVCGVCGAGLLSAHNTHKTNSRRYICKKQPGRPLSGGLSVVASPLESLVSEAVILRLSSTQLPRTEGPTGSRIAEALAGIAETRAKMDDFTRGYMQGIFSRSEFMSARDAAQSRISSLEQIVARGSRSSVFRQMPIGNEAALREAWQGWRIAERRAVICALIERVVIEPRGASGPRFRPDRVDLQFKV